MLPAVPGTVCLSDRQHGRSELDDSVDNRHRKRSLREIVRVPVQHVSQVTDSRRDNAAFPTPVRFVAIVRPEIAPIADVGGGWDGIATGWKWTQLLVGGGSEAYTAGIERSMISRADGWLGSCFDCFASGTWSNSSKSLRTYGVGLAVA